MARVRFADRQSRPTEFLDVTSLTLNALQPLVPPFEAAFHAPMGAWRLDGQPRTARRFRVYQTCPLPTPEDRLLFLLASVKTSSLQVVQGRLFGMGQSKANQGMHVLLPALRAALRALGRCPDPLPDGSGATARRLGGRHRGRAARGGVSTLGRCARCRIDVPPFAHDGTERRIVRPHDPVKQTGGVSRQEQRPHGQTWPVSQCPASHPLAQ
jgi:hypothetical protein